ncbi:hypothetical protein BTM29_08045 [Companilactobacillus allii]|uniref:Fido domain-containing protein n=2 Tax=Companilactobacillus allii TaxID=1847728 RepID=A0A1P8Q3T1_9LACO|nr:Fic family protein [Companilactobacillus allii]APX72501.1 hypothetical protein BTM29_08045 [Companilactobacillus allii]
MKEYKIKYRKSTYQGVIYWTYRSDEEFKNLLRIMHRQLMEKFRIPKGASLSVFSKQVDASHGKIIAELDGMKFKQYLVVGVSTIYLNINDFIKFNSDSQKIFKESGVYGKYGVTDIGTLQYTVDNVKNSISFGKDICPTIISKASKYWYRTAYYQAFSNGNKRTGLLAAMVFLYLNFYIFDSRDVDIESDLYKKVSMNIANKKMSEYDVYAFIWNNVKYDIDRSTENFIMRGK